jgi:hypothetical protein
MKILIACEESQTVCTEFRKMGHVAYSCDLLDTSGNFPFWHIKDNVLNHLDKGWDMLIAFPPCDDLAVSGAKYFKQKIENGKQQQAVNFFLKLANCNIEKICIENPVGIMSKIYRKPDQIIQPYYFGDQYRKTTCLWLKNLPKLQHTKTENLFFPVTHVNQGSIKNGYPTWLFNNDKKHRSKTFLGIARAMAEQWG